LPGFAFANAISSFTLRIGSLASTVTSSGNSQIIEIGVKSRCASYGSLEYVAD
jgi:hypothetical protein